jgi:pimeloyl-ACP methyl ester carboxylesterase
MWRWFHDVQRSSAPHACADLVDMLVGADLTAALPGIRVPMLILAPDDSPFVTVEQQVERLRAVPGSELQVIAGARHGLAHSHGRQCARALRDFLGRRVSS